MLAKLSALLSSKVALAAIGGTLVVGSTVTVAAAATGHLPAGVTIPGISQSHGDSHDNSGDQGHHGHTIGIEGILTGYDGSAHTITVTGRADDQGDAQQSGQDGTDQNNDGVTGTPTDSATPTGTTTDSGDVKASDGNNSTGTPTTGTPAASTPTTEDPKCTISSPVTVTVNGSTKYTGQVKSEGDLANAIGHQVQVQATASSDCKTLTAWKVTVGGKGDQHGKPVVGKVGSIGSSSFTVQPEHGSAVTVNVSSNTKFEGAAHGLGDLKSGMLVGVLGTQQSDGSINADVVAAETSDDHGDGSGHGGGSQGQHSEVSGTIASINTSGTQSFNVTTEDNQSVTVLVGASTQYFGAASSFGDLKTGMRVGAQGTLQSGNLQAAQVLTQAAGSHE